MLRPLGLPPGSVRALLLLGLGVRAVLDLRADFAIAPWLATALIVSAASYFSTRSTARGGMAGTLPAGTDAPKAHPPLFLPAGTVRTLFLGLVAYGTWLWFHHHEAEVRNIPVAWVLAAFVLGVILRWILAKARRPDDEGTGGFWHLEALVALACVGGLIAIALGGLPDVPGWIEPLLAAGTVFYFGTR